METLSAYSVEEMDEEAMTAFILAPTCQRKVLSQYMDLESNKVDCISTDSVFCDRCKVSNGPSLTLNLLVLSTQYRFFRWGVARASIDFQGTQYRYINVGNITTGAAIEKLRLGYIIAPTVATPFPSIACENSYWEWIYLRWLLSSLHFDGVVLKPNISGRNHDATQLQCDCTTQCSTHIRIAIEKLELEYIIKSIVPTLFPLIACENSHWK